ncbi:MAG: peptidase dimerization domain-containing protein [Veillonella sp.]|nr:peptidase dimerization domain-containing protein [Veillonella sp.]
MKAYGFAVQQDVSDGNIAELKTSLRADRDPAGDVTSEHNKVVRIHEDGEVQHHKSSEMPTHENGEVQNQLQGQVPFKMAFLGEYDALPELGHGCGHNLIAPMSMGAAIGFAAARPDAVTTFFGCPAEETVGGKVYMAESGVFAGYNGALLTHPGDANELGGSSLASHPLEVVFHGKAAHIAAPKGSGINALDCLVTYYGRVKALLDTWGDEALIGIMITEGGAAPNIIPERAALHMTVRAKHVEFLENTMLPALRQTAQACAEQYGATVTCRHYEPLFKDLREDKTLQYIAFQVMTKYGEMPQILPDDMAEGSTDMGNVSHEIPTLQLTLQIGQDLGLHTPAFVAAAKSDKALQQVIKGAKMMAEIAILYGACEADGARINKA